MLQRIRTSIILRTTLLVLGVALGIGLLANLVATPIARRYETRREQARIRGLLAVLEPSASAACFVGDQRLAEDVAKGLLNSPGVAAVVIRGTEGELAQARTPNPASARIKVVQPVYSPFDKAVAVGEIDVFLDQGELDRIVARYVWLLSGVVLLVALGVGVALVFTVLVTVLKPIMVLSERLNRMEASPGMRLTLPTGHEDNEIGRLVTNINLALVGVEERARLEKQVELLHAQKLNSLGSLAGGVAHDFNNMLAAILGWAELLLTQEPDPRRQRYIQSIIKAATRSGELTAKLLAFGRRGKNRVVAVELSAAVAECLAMLQPSIHPDLQVVTDLAPGLHLDGDPAQIQQVLVNLCLNAVEALAGRGTLRLTSRRIQLEGDESRLAAGTYVELEIADTGPGMDKDVLAQIFEPFFTTKTQKGESGTGLGLATVYGIVDAHKGTVTVDSAPGAGATFRILLPEGAMPLEAPARVRKPAHGEGFVLVVEDEETLRELARASLEQLGYTVATAQDGRAGVAAFWSHHHQLQAVLLDIKMPVMGGLEAFKAMRAIDPSVPVVICTGYAENEEVQEILSLGGAGMLAKPYQLLDLSDLLKSLGTGVPSAV